MKPTLYSGLLFVFLGLVFSVWATKYNIGTASNMGPGYFPLVLGVMLVATGVLNLIKSLITNEAKVAANIAWRPLILVVLANILFGALLHLMGLIVATVALIIVSSYATTEARAKETILLAILLSVVSCAIFVWGLNMPLLIFPKF